MADAQTGTPEQPQTTDTAPDKGGQQAAKTFTQDELNTAIGERLQREQRKFDKERTEFTAKFADYDEMKKAAAKWQETENAKKTEMEKLADRIAKQEAQYAELQSQNARLAQERAEALIRSAIVAKSATFGFRDPTDAWRMIDLAALTLQDDGTIDKLDEQLKALGEQKPYLLQAQPEQQQQQSLRISPTNPGHGHEQQETDAQRRQRLYGYGGTPIGGTNSGGLVMPAFADKKE